MAPNVTTNVPPSLKISSSMMDSPGRLEELVLPVDDDDLDDRGADQIGHHRRLEDVDRPEPPARPRVHLAVHALAPANRDQPFRFIDWEMTAKPVVAARRLPT